MSEVKILADDEEVGNYAARLIFDEIVKTAHEKKTVRFRLSWWTYATEYL